MIIEASAFETTKFVVNAVDNDLDSVNLFGLEVVDGWPVYFWPLVCAG